MIIGKRITLPLVVLVAGVVALSAASIGPTEQVKLTVDGVLRVLKDKSLDKATREERVSSMIRKRFDFRAMSQRTLGVNWKKASPKQRVRFIDLFSDLLEATYIERIEAYTDEHVEYVKEKVEGRRAAIDTVVVTKSADIPVRYKLIQRGEEWFVYDVVVEEVSLIRNFRSSYREIAKREGLPGLFARMEEKIKELKNPHKDEAAQ